MIKAIQQKLSSQKWLNVMLAALLALLFIINSYKNSVRWNSNFDLFVELKGGLILALAVLVTLIPLYWSLSYLNKKTHKKGAARILEIIFLPLLGSTLVPGLALLIGLKNDNGYLAGFAVIFLSINLVFYVFNEILLLINLKKN
ncbi:hypothetical protein HZA44_00195 [Candidatus Peregrinibacteria bacterium]|nr:hypothetical protein [Candidatus Peregrinibacteria bacterium]